MNQKKIASPPKKPRILMRSASRSSSKENSMVLQTPKTSQFLYKPPQNSIILKQNNEFLNNFQSPLTKTSIQLRVFHTTEKENKPIKAFADTLNKPEFKEEESNENIPTQNSIHENHCKPFELSNALKESSRYTGNSVLLQNNNSQSSSFKKKSNFNEYRSSSCFVKGKMNDIECEKTNKKVEQLLESIKKETEKQKKSFAQITFFNEANNKYENSQIISNKSEEKHSNMLNSQNVMTNFKYESPKRKNYHQTIQEFENNQINGRENLMKNTINSINQENFSKGGSTYNSIQLKDPYASEKMDSYYKNFVYSDEKKEAPEIDILKYAIKVETPLKVTQINKEKSEYEKIKPHLNPFLAIKNVNVQNYEKKETINNKIINTNNENLRAASSNPKIHNSETNNKNIESMVEECLKKTKLALKSLENVSFSSSSNSTSRNNLENKKRNKCKENEEEIKKSNIEDMFLKAVNRSETAISKHKILKKTQKTNENIENTNNFDCKYNGNYLNNQKHGFGLLSDKNDQKIYIGDWKADKFHGQGVLHNKNIEKLSNINFRENINYKCMDFNKEPWKMYEGEFQDGMFHGIGSVIFVNGERINGKFFKGKLNGEGTFYHPDGEIIIGFWENGILKRMI